MNVQTIFNLYHKHWTTQKLLHIWLTAHVLILDFKDGKVIFSKVICHESSCTLFTLHSCTHDMPIRVVVLSYVFFQTTFSWQLSRNLHLWFQIVPRYVYHNPLLWPYRLNLSVLSLNKAATTLETTSVAATSTYNEFCIPIVSWKSKAFIESFNPLTRKFFFKVRFVMHVLKNACWLLACL